jgi:Holliday junction resolvase RusA-like endonuclease
MSQLGIPTLEREPAQHVDLVSFTVLDPPRGKGRPRFGNGRAYSDSATRHAESAVRAAWKDAGGETLPPGVPLACEARMYLQRPQNHYKRDGSFSAAGERSIYPLRKPDVDNAAKLVLDACEGYAYPADAAIVYLHVLKFWCVTGDSGPRTAVSIRVLT